MVFSATDFQVSRQHFDLFCTGNSEIPCHWSQVRFTTLPCSHMNPAKHRLHRSTKKAMAWEHFFPGFSWSHCLQLLYPRQCWTVHRTREKVVRKNSFWQLREDGDTSAGSVCQVSAIFARRKNGEQNWTRARASFLVWSTLPSGKQSVKQQEWQTWQELLARREGEEVGHGYFLAGGDGELSGTPVSTHPSTKLTKQEDEARKSW